MLADIALGRVTDAHDEVDSFIHTRAAAYGWAGCALHKRVWQRDWLSFPRHAGGEASICGKGHSFQTHTSSHLPAKSQVLGSCTGPRAAAHGPVVCRLGACAVPSLWWGSITEFLPLLTECHGPLQLHTQAHSQGNSNSWSLTAPGSGAGGAGAYTPSGPATHTHTAPLSAGPQSLSPLRPTSCPAAPAPADTGPDAQIQGTGSSSASQDYARTHNRACVTVTQNTGHPRGVPDTTRKDTQYHPGSTPEPPPDTHAEQLPVDTQPCVYGHSCPQHPTVRHSLDITAPWDHTQLQDMARDPPQPAAPGHAATARRPWTLVSQPDRQPRGYTRQCKPHGGASRSRHVTLRQTRPDSTPSRTHTILLLPPSRLLPPCPGHSQQLRARTQDPSPGAER